MIAPLSFGQQRLWFLYQVDPESPAYNCPGTARLTGPLNVAVTCQLVEEIVRRHAILRTTCRASEEYPVQVVDMPRVVSLPLIDLSGMPAAVSESVATELASEGARRAFDMERGPLWRVRLIRLSEQDHVIMFVMHHIIFDEWSAGVLFREFASLYEAYQEGFASPLAELEVQFGDYALWQSDLIREGVLESELAYWTDRLSGHLPDVRLPTDKPAPETRSFNGARCRQVFSDHLFQKLRAAAHKEGATLYLLMLTAFQAFLHYRTAEEDMIIGTNIANRGRYELEGLIGYFVNQLVLRTDLTGDPSFRELLDRVREVVLEAYNHQELPFDRLVDALNPARNLRRNPFFQIMFVMQSAGRETIHLPGLKVSPFAAEGGTAKVDLILSIAEGSEKLAASIDYDANLFEASTITRMLVQYEAVLTLAADQPDIRLSALKEALAQVEQEWQLSEEFTFKEAQRKKLKLLKRRDPSRPSARGLSTEQTESR